jgi:Tol biopolymer transport system component
VLVLLVSGFSLTQSACQKKSQPVPTPPSVPHSIRWGIFELDITSQEIKQLYGTHEKIEYLDLNTRGEKFVFAQFFNGYANENAEVCSFDMNSQHFQRLTDNQVMDVYPVWAPDNNRIAFLSMGIKNLDIYLMNFDGSGRELLFDSGNHDADINWVGNTIAFTSDSKIWLMQDDGTRARQLTSPPRAGTWGKANLPFGDYDPKISPDGRLIAFERLEDDTSPHGNYNIFIVSSNGTNEKRLTENGYSQGIVSWSHSGDKIVWVVAAIGEQALYDIFTMNADGSNLANITPDYFPPDFICRNPVFSPGDDKVYFIGEWWEE